MENSNLLSQVYSIHEGRITKDILSNNKKTYQITKHIFNTSDILRSIQVIIQYYG